jgi:hypothetical protein
MSVVVRNTSVPQFSQWRAGSCGHANFNSSVRMQNTHQCSRSDKQGALKAQTAKLCAKFCRMRCEQCAAVSYSHKDHECSWFALEQCPHGKKPRDTGAGHRTLWLRGADGMPLFDGEDPRSFLGKRVKVVNLPKVPHQWWYKLKGQEGVARDYLHENSLAPPRIPVEFEVESMRHVFSRFCVGPVKGSLWAQPPRPCRILLNVQPRFLMVIDNQSKSEAVPVAARRPPYGDQERARGDLDTSLFLTVATSGYKHWLCHLRLNLIRLGVSSQTLHVCVFDDETEEFVRSQGMTPTRAAGNRSLGGGGRGGGGRGGGGGGGGGSGARAATFNSPSFHRMARASGARCFRSRSTRASSFLMPTSPCSPTRGRPSRQTMISW